MDIHNSSLQIGGLIAVGLIGILSMLPPPPKQDPEEQKKKEVLTKEERRRIVKEGFRDRIRQFNPEAKDEDLDVMINKSRERQKAFLGKMDPLTREGFLKTVKRIDKEMKKVENMTEEELQSKMVEIEANQFRVCIFKILIIAIFMYIMACLIYKTPDIEIISEKFWGEMDQYLGWINNRRGVQSPISKQVSDILDGGSQDGNTDL